MRSCDLSGVPASTMEAVTTSTVSERSECEEVVFKDMGRMGLNGPKFGTERHDRDHMTKGVPCSLCKSDGHEDVPGRDAEDLTRVDGARKRERENLNRIGGPEAQARQYRVDHGRNALGPLQRISVTWPTRSCILPSRSRIRTFHIYTPWGKSSPSHGL